MILNKGLGETTFGNLAANALVDRSAIEERLSVSSMHEIALGGAPRETGVASSARFIRQM